MIEFRKRTEADLCQNFWSLGASLTAKGALGQVDLILVHSDVLYDTRSAELTLILRVVSILLIVNQRV